MVTLACKPRACSFGTGPPAPVPSEGLATVRSQAAQGARDLADEALLDRHVAALFQPCQMALQIAVAVMLLVAVRLDAGRDGLVACPAPMMRGGVGREVETARRGEPGVD